MFFNNLGQPSEPVNPMDQTSDDGLFWGFNCSSSIMFWWHHNWQYFQSLPCFNTVLFWKTGFNLSKNRPSLRIAWLLLVYDLQIKYKIKGKMTINNYILIRPTYNVFVITPKLPSFLIFWGYIGSLLHISFLTLAEMLIPPT